MFKEVFDRNPMRNHLAISKTVIKGGKVYDPTAIEKALGITPREVAGF